MSTVPLIPDTAPFTAEQRAWLNGFFAGLYSRAPNGSSPAAGVVPSAPTEGLTPLTVLFGSQTGTAERLAKQAAKEAGRRGFAATVLDMAQTDATRLAAEKNVLVIVSTFGEGEPPDGAKPLHTALGDGPSPSLASVRFSVCALGDTNYVQFCQCGKDFDARFEKHGATRVSARVDCDLDYEAPFTTWLDTALGAFSSEVGRVVPNAPSPSAGAAVSKTPEAAYSRKKPFPALLLASRNLNAPGSAKQVHHVELSLAGSNLAYEAGDALGVMPQNCPEQVNDVLAALGCDGEEAVPAPDGSTAPLRRALTEFYDLGKPTEGFLALVGACLQAIPSTPAIASKLAPTPEPVFHHVIDVLLGSPGVKLTPVDFVRALKKLQPRLYSIASSPRAHFGKVHLTVGAVRYEKENRGRKGVCSTFLADRAQAGSTAVGVFVHSNPAFRPPLSGDTAMIMVGPGTGIAPFRAFLHERQAAGAKGRAWLFFGDQCAATDFLYQEELATLQRSGGLTRLDTAFSRDQPEKIYVQHRMLEHAAELFAWLADGAHFYVCGDASRMAKDVEAALHAVVERGGGKTREEAAAFVQDLRSSRRYCRDVY